MYCHCSLVGSLACGASTPCMCVMYDPLQTCLAGAEHGSNHMLPGCFAASPTTPGVHACCSAAPWRNALVALLHQPASAAFPAVTTAVPLQLCFDFIESAADGQLYCIECNPRTSTVITEFHDNTELVAGVLRCRSGAAAAACAMEKECAGVWVCAGWLGKELFSNRAAVETPQHTQPFGNPF